MSLANKLSLFRILLVPGFVLCLIYYRPGELDALRFLALSIFGVAVVTDAVDGYLARAEHQASRLGAILDPAADKLLLVTAFLSLALIKTLPPELRLPAWVPIVVISRDLIIVCGWLLIALVTGDIEARPSRLGKWTTFAQMLAVVTILLGAPMAHRILWVAMGLTVLSGVGYLRLGNRLLNFAGPRQ